MFGLLVLGAMFFAALVVLWAVGWAFGLFFWLLFLPFRILGLVFRGFGLLIGIPLLMAGGVIAALVFGAGFLVLMFPLVPLALLALGAWWLVKRGRSRSTASVVS